MIILESYANYIIDINTPSIMLSNKEQEFIIMPRKCEYLFPNGYLQVITYWPVFPCTSPSYR